MDNARVHLFGLPHGHGGFRFAAEKGGASRQFIPDDLQLTFCYMWLYLARPFLVVWRHAAHVSGRNLNQV